jgi:FkbM family methyltransferase
VEYFSRDEVERIGRAGVRWFGESVDGYIKCRILSSFWLYCEADDEAFTPWMKSDGFWEAWVTKWMSGKFQQNTHFIDIGANVGYYTMLAAEAGLTVAAVEPNPHVRELLTWSVRENRYKNVEVIPEAMGARKKAKATLSVPRKHSGGAYVGTKPAESDYIQYEIGVNSVDNMFSHMNENVLIKIDAEGFEPEIWAGMQKFRQRNNVTVALEWDGSRYDAEKFAEELYKSEVRLIDYDGEEKVISKQELLGLNGIYMIVVR